MSVYLFPKPDFELKVVGAQGLAPLLPSPLKSKGINFPLFDREDSISFFITKLLQLFFARMKKNLK
jgi:hypothetical protein